MTRQYVIRLIEQQDGNVSFQYEGNLPMGSVIASLELIKAQVIQQMLTRYQMRQQSKSQDIPGMLTGQLKRVPNPDGDNPRYKLVS